MLNSYTFIETFTIFVVSYSKMLYALHVDEKIYKTFVFLFKSNECTIKIFLIHSFVTGTTVAYKLFFPLFNFVRD